MKTSSATSQSTSMTADQKALLIVTQTCPACRVTTQWLDKMGIAYEKVYADQNAHVTEKYDVKSVPTLVVNVSHEGNERKLTGFHEIRAYFS